MLTTEVWNHVDTFYNHRRRSLAYSCGDTEVVQIREWFKFEYFPLNTPQNFRPFKL